MSEPSAPELAAALFVARDGAYSGLDGVDVWDVSRDARTYGGVTANG